MQFISKLAFPRGQEVVKKRNPSMLGAVTCWDTNAVPELGRKWFRRPYPDLLQYLDHSYGFCFSAVEVTRDISLE